MSLILIEDRGAVRHVVLNRPEKRNAMSQALLKELGEALREAAAQETVHCVARGRSSRPAWTSRS
jgi:enoyl-CoA hydratase/carnithine racemase